MTDRAVFDCMIYLQGAGRGQSPAAACFRLVEEGQVTLCLSPPILSEVREVLSRPSLQQKFPPLTPQWVNTFLSNFEQKAVLVTDVPRTFSHACDPDDEPYVNLALVAGARYLVTRDKDLLDLMKDTSFRQRFPDLTILDPVAFLQTLSSNRPEKPAPAGE
ncbi:MAG: putative toxin-antitoxin system toxin component, PIN family [Gemmataceae bacterium]|nr:putative toxin-antitoxin system toxin component, PIN family [Gemmataceae bacterium]